MSSAMPEKRLQGPGAALRTTIDRGSSGKNMGSAGADAMFGRAGQADAGIAEKSARLTYNL
ncbi:MAG: hypothetical protein DI554_10855 [Sphingobium sp.]|nr:MAG: hypothetical protein DI554_10855 [Sphingobium sp.]